MAIDPFSTPIPDLRCGFAGGGLDRADHWRKDDAQVAAMRLRPDARWLVLDQLRPLTAPAEDGTPDIAWQRRSMLPADAPEVFLGVAADGAPRFAAACPAADMSGEPMDARAFAALAGDGRAGIVAQARSLLDWHARHGFCAVCGAPTRMVKSGYARQCSACGAEHFPRTDPVVIMLVLKDDHALLGRQPRFPKGFLSAIAGFVEVGESLEEAIQREVWEETGTRCLRTRYIASQPWPFPSSLMIGAFAEVDRFEVAPDFDELEELRWVTRAEARAALDGHGDFSAPPPLAIAHTLLKAWVDLEPVTGV